MSEPANRDRTPHGRRCRVCGCTDDDCPECVLKLGHPCCWVEADLCSACAEADDARPLRDRDVWPIKPIGGRQ